jgi:hypothetical protein
VLVLEALMRPAHPLGSLGDLPAEKDDDQDAGHGEQQHLPEADGEGHADQPGEDHPEECERDPEVQGVLEALGEAVKPKAKLVAHGAYRYPATGSRNAAAGDLQAVRYLPVPMSRANPKTRRLITTALAVAALGAAAAGCGEKSEPDVSTTPATTAPATTKTPTPPATTTTKKP